MPGANRPTHYLRFFDDCQKSIAEHIIEKPSQILPLLSLCTRCCCGIMLTFLEELPTFCSLSRSLSQPWPYSIAGYQKMSRIYPNWGRSVSPFPPRPKSRVAPFFCFLRLGLSFFYSCLRNSWPPKSAACRCLSQRGGEEQQQLSMAAKPRALN